jgi:hypothetical protein
MSLLRARMKANTVMICIVLLLVIPSSLSFTPRFSATYLSAAASASSSRDEDWIFNAVDDDVVVEESSSSSAFIPPAVQRRRQRLGPVIRRVDAASLERQEQAQEDIVQARQRQTTAQQDPNLLSGMSFAQVLMDSGNDKQYSSVATTLLLRALHQDLGEHAKMTRIQAATYRPVRDGCSILARARTGTGKTLAFLIMIRKVKDFMSSNARLVSSLWYQLENWQFKLHMLLLD